ncbi:unnamed protein product, partial [Prorocentrum cordatum]
GREAPPSAGPRRRGRGARRRRRGGSPPRRLFRLPPAAHEAAPRCRERTGLRRANLRELGGKAGARPYGKARGGRAGHERSSPFALSGCRGAGKGSAPASCRVFVGNLPYSVRWQELKDHMRSVGDVVFCDIMEEPGTALNSK